ncbi:MAG: hypothetical protein GY849_19405 [Deltaproteobacteria bacterium]|nr:hypothetical protein [Deltaproteobacteria bacterium]
MTVREAIMAFSQSEKIKSGLIWVSQLLELVKGLSGPEKLGGERMIKAGIGMVVQEVRLAKTVARDASWEDVEKGIDQAIVMIDSGVASESVVHLTRALSEVTGIGHRSMSFLKDQGHL